MSSYGQYTKHYFANDRRVSSRVGGGLPQGADAPHTTQLPSGRSWYDRAVAMKEQMERAFECADMTEDRLEFATSWGVESLIGANTDAEVFFYHQNHQGSPVFVSTASGYLTEQQLLQAYGEVFASAQNAASWRSPYSFTGKEFDAESGLHYFGARYYLSSLGVWLSTDPLADQFANVSPYAYAANNPALFTDRWGLAPDPPAWWKAIVSGVREMFKGPDKRQTFEDLGAVLSSIPAIRNGNTLQAVDVVGQKVQPKVRDRWENFTSYFKMNSTLYFNAGVNISLGAQAGVGVTVNDTRLKAEINLASIQLARIDYTQLENSRGPEYLDSYLIGLSEKYYISQGAAMPLLGYERSFETTGYGTIPGSLNHALSLGPMIGDTQGKRGFRIGLEATFILGVEVYIEVGKE